MHILRFVILSITFLVWSCGLSAIIANWLSDLGLISSKSKFGDLYQFSALSQFKEEFPAYPTFNRSSDTSLTQLYIIGDSFTHPLFLSKSDFHVSNYERWGETAPVQFQLDSTKRNVLLIECVERNFRQNFKVPPNQINLKPSIDQPQTWLGAFSERFNRIFNKNRIESRLETAVFNHDWAFKFKELKAELTLRCFDRTDIMVSLSRNRRHLFFFMDTDERLPLNSSFSELTDNEVDALVSQVNTTADHYRKLGFDEVYLSIIPNKASILETERTDYNHLIERIQDNFCLKVPTINAYSAFKRSKISPYLKGDTHWNCSGREIWLKLVWQKLRV